MAHGFRSPTLALLALLAPAGCDLGSEASPEPTTIAVTPASLSFDALGDTATLGAAVLDQKENPLPAAVPTWTSGSPTVLEVTPEGLVTALGNGNSFVTATAGAASRTVPVSVLQRAHSLEVQQGNGQAGSAGAPLPLPLRIVARDRLGGEVPGARLSFTVTSGGGAVTPSPATANGEGVATAGWTLGTVAGAPQSVLVSVLGAAHVTAQLTATALPGAPFEFLGDGGAGQVFPQGQLLPDPVTVRLLDALGNPIPGAPVAFAVTAGGGSVEPASTTTGPDGRASAAWTLGGSLGAQGLEATTAGLAPVPFGATAFPTPGSLLVEAGGGESAPAGTGVDTPPAVKLLDGGGLPIPSVPIEFSVTGGGGSVQSPGGAASETATVSTDAQGVAALAAWTLGTVVGANAVEARVPGGPSVELSAAGVPGPPALLQIVAGDDQRGDPSTALPATLVVRVTDAFGNPVEGVTVDFTAASGSGAANPPSAVSDAEGLAETTWTLGPANGPHSLGASFPGGPAALFTARTGGLFRFEFTFTPEVTPQLQQALLAAAARWSEVILEGVVDQAVSVAANSCGVHPAASLNVDDVHVYAFVRAIDGPGGALAQAGACYLRDDESADPFLPAVGRVTIDSSDLTTALAGDLLDDVLVHELGHVLGFGTIWGPGFAGLLQNQSNGVAPLPDTHFNGAGAVAAFDAVGGTGYFGAKVPVQNSGNSGSRNSHWRTSVFQSGGNSEVMVGTILSSGSALSRVTVASLGDLGYVVDLLGADPYTLPGAGMIAEGARGTGEGGAAIVLEDDVVPGPYFVVGRDGRTLRTIEGAGSTRESSVPGR